jgi:hypothetical protein
MNSSLSQVSVARLNRIIASLNSARWSTLIYAAIASPLQASVILTQPPSPLIAFDPSDPPVDLDLDIDGDGTPDYVIPGGSTQIHVNAQAANRVLAFDEFGTHYTANLAEGSFIGDVGLFQRGRRHLFWQFPWRHRLSRHRVRHRGSNALWLG